MGLRISISSDEHGDIAGNAIVDRPQPGVDLIIRAGDLRANGVLALHQLRHMYPDPNVAIAYCAGNHDFYSEHDKNHPELKTTWEKQLAEMPVVAKDLGIILLQDTCVEAEIAGYIVKLMGGTGWTRYDARPPYLSFNEATRQAARAMNDYRLAKVEPGRSRDKLQPRDTINAHKKTVRFLEEQLALPVEDGTIKIVVTHHAPSYRSLRNWDPAHPERFSDLDFCYASDLEYLMHGDAAPDLWVFGHIHENRDFFVGQTRLVANPRGYPGSHGGRENPHYDPDLVIELEPRLDLAPTFRM